MHLLRTIAERAALAMAFGGGRLSSAVMSLLRSAVMGRAEATGPMAFFFAPPACFALFPPGLPGRWMRVGGTHARCVACVALVEGLCLVHCQVTGLCVEIPWWKDVPYHKFSGAGQIEKQCAHVPVEPRIAGDETKSKEGHISFLWFVTPSDLEHAHVQTKRMMWTQYSVCGHDL